MTLLGPPNCTSPVCEGCSVHAQGNAHLSRLTRDRQLVYIQSRPRIGKTIEHENANFRKWPLPKPRKIELCRLFFFWIWRLHRSQRYTSEWSWKFKCPQCQSRMNKILCRVDCGRLLLNKGWYSHTSSHTNTIEPQDLEIKHISFFSSRFIQILIEKHIGDDWSAYPERTPRSPTLPNKALLKKGLWKPLVSLNKAGLIIKPLFLGG